VPVGGVIEYAEVSFNQFPIEPTQLLTAPASCFCSHEFPQLKYLQIVEEMVAHRASVCIVTAKIERLRGHAGVTG
jgi:hypothetical protein